MKKKIYACHKLRSIVWEVICYGELATSSIAVAVTIAGTHFAYPKRDGQAELAW